MTSSPEKYCTRCKETKPRTEFHRNTYRGVNKGYRSACKPCFSRICGDRIRRNRAAARAELKELRALVVEATPFIELMQKRSKNGVGMELLGGIVADQWLERKAKVLRADPS